MYEQPAQARFGQPPSEEPQCRNNDRLTDFSASAVCAATLAKRDRSFRRDMCATVTGIGVEAGHEQLHDISRAPSRRSCLDWMRCRIRLWKRGATLCVAEIIIQPQCSRVVGLELIPTSFEHSNHNRCAKCKNICRASGHQQRALGGAHPHYGFDISSAASEQPALSGACVFSQQSGVKSRKHVGAGSARHFLRAMRSFIIIHSLVRNFASAANWQYRRRRLVVACGCFGSLGRI
jgi:hypothetical protein